MRPLIKSLFVLSVFGVLAVHVSTGFLRTMIEDSAPGLVNFIDHALRVLLIAPLGRDVTIYGLWVAGGALAFVVFIMTPATSSRGGNERHSTW